MILYAHTYLKNIEEVQTANKDMHTCISASDIDRVAQIIQLRNKATVPLRGLRLVLVRPSHLKAKAEHMLQGMNGQLDLATINAWALI